MMQKHSRVIVVMPAFNAERTLKLTYEDMPKDCIDLVILVDDGSTDKTVKIAKELGLKIFLHSRNYGYGANQKTCYMEALKENPDIIVMLHPDYQYDPSLLPQLIEPIEKGVADIVLGSRLLVDDALKRGMPWWKYIANRFLTGVENAVLQQNLSEYHTGYRAYSRRFLESVPFILNSDGFVFDQEILVEAIHNGFRIVEIPVPAKYFKDASSAGFVDSLIYGFSILYLMLRYKLHKSGILRQKKFESLVSRYRAMESE
jgi:glycosyltransferase involved in cell wall biosynthesis